MADNGYDISDYYKISPEFGTMEDFKLLLKEAKNKNIKIIMDLILNHTSDEHPWFINACHSKASPYRDYYIWQPGKTNSLGQEQEPTNWSSFFSSSCWTKDSQSGEYYMHIFSKKMPDLNWRNKKMRQELYQMITWWLELGIDGFRVDAVAHLDRDFNFIDSELSKTQNYCEDWAKFSNLPRVHEYLKELNREVFSKYDLVTIGEVGGRATVEDVLNYTKTSEKELNMVFTFDHCWHNRIWNPKERHWEKQTDLIQLKQIFNKWQTGLYSQAWASLYWLNHDHPRLLSQYGNEIDYPKESGKMLATALLMMWGTPFLYNGEEIGMTNPNFSEFTDYQDSVTIEKVDRLLRAGHSQSEVLRYIQLTARDNARTPMQWNSSVNAGFSSGNPWIKVAKNYSEINVETQQQDPDSILNYYKKLLKLRRNSPYKKLIIYGDYQQLAPKHPYIYAYIRQLEERKILVLCNFFEKVINFNLPEFTVKKIIISNYKDPTLHLELLRLRAFETIVFEID